MQGGQQGPRAGMKHSFHPYIQLAGRAIENPFARSEMSFTTYPTVVKCGNGKYLQIDVSIGKPYYP